MQDNQEQLELHLRDNQNVLFEIRRIGADCGKDSVPLFNFRVAQISKRLDKAAPKVKRLDLLSDPGPGFIQQAKDIFEALDIPWSEPTWFYAILIS